MPNKGIILPKVSIGKETIDPSLIDRPAAEKAMGDFLTALGINWQRDVNMCGTPARVTKMYADEFYAGRTSPAPDITDFVDKKNRSYQSLLISGPWPVYSSCSHHMLPVHGSCIVGLLPNKGQNIPGLSKYGRVVNWFARRPQLQEDLVEDIANYFEEKFSPMALGVYINATHLCCTHRGILAKGSSFTTTSLRGTMFKDDLRSEFISECHHLLKTGG